MGFSLDMLIVSLRMTLYKFKIFLCILVVESILLYKMFNGSITYFETSLTSTTFNSIFYI